MKNGLKFYHRMPSACDSINFKTILTYTYIYFIPFILLLYSFSFSNSFYCLYLLFFLYTPIPLISLFFLPKTTDLNVKSKLIKFLGDNIREENR